MSGINSAEQYYVAVLFCQIRTLFCLEHVKANNLPPK